MPSSPSPISRRRRAARINSGQALFGAVAATVRLLRWLLLGLVGIYLGSGITRIGPHEDALIYRLGRLQREVHPPGLLFALPPPFDRVVRIPTRIQHELFLISWSPDESSAILSPGGVIAATPNPAPAAATPPLNPMMLALLPGIDARAAAVPALAPTGKGLHPVFDGYTLTGDTNLVQARLTARYRIVDPLAYVAAAQSGAVKDLIESSIYSAATRVLATMRIDDALGAGLESLREQVRALAQARFDALHLGVDLVAFEVNALTPPQATIPAFTDVTSAQVESRTTLEQARAYRAQMVPKSQSDAYRIRQQADADVKQLVARASGEATAFGSLLNEFRLAPALVEARLRAEAVEQIMSRVKTKTFLPADEAPLNLFLREK